MRIMLYQRISISLVLFCCATAHAETVIPAPPKIKASSYLAVDFHSGKYVISESIDEQVEPASLTKMMTVYVAAHELAEGIIKYDDMVLISEKAWRMEGSKMFIEVNKRVAVDDLLKGVIIQSGNDASVALAEHVAGSEEAFAQLMNQHAAELGMTGTNFVNSSGLPHSDHYTTARDMALLARSLIERFPDIYALHAVKDYTFNGIKQDNRNPLLWRDDTVDGIKTGHTSSAGYCLVSSARRGDMRLIAVVMGTESEEDRARSSQSILNFAFRFYETHKLYGAAESITTAKLWKGEIPALDLGIEEDLYITIPRGTYKQLDAIVDLQEQIIAPITAGQAKGALRVNLGDEEIANRPLVALTASNKGSLINQLRDEFFLLFE